MAERVFTRVGKAFHHLGQVAELTLSGHEHVQGLVGEQVERYSHTTSIAPPRCTIRWEPTDLATPNRDSTVMECLAQWERHWPVSKPADLDDPSLHARCG